MVASATTLWTIPTALRVVGSFASSFSWFIASFGLVGIDGEDVRGSYGMVGMSLRGPT